MAQQFIGSLISLISKSEIRYQGILHAIDTEEATISLEKVRSMGTEGRKGDPSQEIPPNDNVYDFIVFRASDIHDLKIEQQQAAAPPPPSSMPEDPAILNQARHMPPYPAQQAYMGYAPPAPYGYPPMGNPYGPNYGAYGQPNSSPFGQPGYPMPPPSMPPQQMPPQAEKRPDVPPATSTQPPAPQVKAAPTAPKAMTAAPAAAPAPSTAPLTAPTGPKAEAAKSPAPAPSKVASQPQPPKPEAAQPVPAQKNGVTSFAAAVQRSTVPPSQPQTGNVASADKAARPSVTAEQVEQLAADLGRTAVRDPSAQSGQSRGGRGSYRGARGGASSNGTPRAAQMPEFDFESSNAKFEATMESIKDKTPSEAFYQKSSSFFDNLSNDVSAKGVEAKPRFDRNEERERNLKTFGEDGRNMGYRGRGQRGGRGRGRGRGRGGPRPEV